MEHVTRCSSLPTFPQHSHTYTHTACTCCQLKKKSLLLQIQVWQFHSSIQSFSTWGKVVKKCMISTKWAVPWVGLTVNHADIQHCYSHGQWYWSQNEITILTENGGQECGKEWEKKKHCVPNMSILSIPLDTLFSFPLFPFFSSFFPSIIDATVFFDFWESSNVRIFLKRKIKTKVYPSAKWIKQTTTLTIHYSLSPLNKSIYVLKFL